MPLDTTNQSLPGAMESSIPPTGLYVGSVMHARLKMPLHRFSYKVFSLFIDLDDMKGLDRSSAFLSHNRFNLISFQDKDHGHEDGSNLREYVDELLSKAGVERASSVRLLCFPRILGYAFNPLSIFYCYGQDLQLQTIVYEVRNTFGEKHAYVAPVRQEDWNGQTLRQTRKKIFFVSPFLEMDMRYHFRLHVPGDELRVRIFETDENGPVLSATHKATWSPLRTGTIVGALFSQQFNALKVIVGIHLEAAKLWIRGAKYHRRGAPPAPASFSDAGT